MKAYPQLDPKKSEDNEEIKQRVSERLNGEKNFGWYHDLYKNDDNIRLAMCEEQYHCEFNETAPCFDIGLGLDQFSDKTR